MRRKRNAYAVRLLALLALPILAIACDRGGTQEEYVETPPAGEMPMDTTTRGY